LQLRTILSLSNDEPTKYDVLSCTISDECLSIAIFDDEEVELPEVLVSALSHLQFPNQQRIIFNDHLAFLRARTEGIRQLLENLPHIHQQAEQIVVWAGTHDEDDQLSPFIGKGNAQLTEEAFDFAHRLKEMPFSSLPALFQEFNGSDEEFRWTRFQQLVYRDFFRGDAILSSNYIASLPNVVVQVSSATIPHPILQTAADLLLKAHPLPRYLSRLERWDPPGPLTAPEGWSHDAWWAILTYEEHFKASIRFGLPTQLLVVQLHYLMKEADGALDSRLATHFGYSDEIMANRGGWNSDAATDLVASFHHQLARSKGDVSIEAIEDPVGRRPRSTPDFDGKKIIPTPIAAHREMFVHSMGTYDEETFAVLLEILPELDLDQPLQCGLREIHLEKPCEFTFVNNHMFLRPPLYEEDDEDEADNAYPSSPPATRTSTQILLNGRSCRIPMIQEIFLRLHRDAEKSKLVHLWNVCRRPKDVGMFRSENLQQYAQTKERMLKRDSHQVRVIDMYKALEKAGLERNEADLERLGKPDGVSWHAWLLELAD
jgi:hypothetical protein